MVSIKAIFDGKVIVPSEPVSLPVNQELVLHIDSPEPKNGGSALDWIADHAVDSSSCPSDMAKNHDHYLYGLPKRDDES